MYSVPDSFSCVREHEIGELLSQRSLQFYSPMAEGVISEVRIIMMHYGIQAR